MWERPSAAGVEAERRSARAQECQSGRLYREPREPHASRTAGLSPTTRPTSTESWRVRGRPTDRMGWRGPRRTQLTGPNQPSAGAAEQPSVRAAEQPSVRAGARQRPSAEAAECCSDAAPDRPSTGVTKVWNARVPERPSDGEAEHRIYQALTQKRSSRGETVCERRLSQKAAECQSGRVPDR